MKLHWTLWILSILSFCERVASEKWIEYNVTSQNEVRNDDTILLFLYHQSFFVVVGNVQGFLQICPTQMLLQDWLWVYFTKLCH